MNFLEAFKTGLPMRRRHFASGWINPAGSLDGLTKQDILAIDWEVKKEPREWVIFKQDGQLKFIEATESFLIEYRGAKPTDVVRVREVIE